MTLVFFSPVFFSPVFVSWDGHKPQTDGVLNGRLTATLFEYFLKLCFNRRQGDDRPLTARYFCPNFYVVPPNLERAFIVA
jgi:hypothetical protein